MQEAGAIPIVVMRDIWKTFPGVLANKGVDIELSPGEVHALLGENGAGKTTLMSILSGIYRADKGEIFIGGKRTELRSPADAIGLGVGMVHQHFRLVDNLTVAENVHLGWKTTPLVVSRRSLARRLQKMASELKLAVDPHAQIWQLSVGEQQRVEILKAVLRGARVLILDEPTSVLTPSESTELFKVLRGMASRGNTVVFISHKLDEVFEVSDRVSVLREGRRVATMPTSGCDHHQLARLMVGQDIVFRSHDHHGMPGETILELQDASGRNDRGLAALKGVSLTVRRGEILGVAGVAGNGQRELAEVLTGLRQLDHGRLIIAGLDRTGRSPRHIALAGVGHIPGDRMGMGLFPSLSVAHNAIVRRYREAPIRKGMLLARKAITDFSGRILRRANVRVPHLAVPVRNLSGGNQQRLLAMREIEIASGVLVSVLPTRGLDVAATEDVRRALVDHRNQGNAIFLISEDLDEILLLSDRIAVMFEGRIVGLFDAKDADRESIGLLMAGGAYERETSL